MELKKVTCPNCGSSEIEKVSDEQYKCSYCGATFMIDYDEEDAQIISKEKELTMQRERFEHEERLRKEAQTSTSGKKAPRFFALFMFVMIVAILALSLFASIYEPNNSSSTESQTEQTSKKKSQYRLLDSSDISAGIDLSEFKKAADTFAQNKKEAYTGSWTQAGEPKLVAEYFLNSEDANMLWFFYEYTWEKEGSDPEKRYVAVHFDDIRMTEDGKIKSNYRPEEYYHSEFLGNYLVSGYFDFDSAYRETITAHPECEITEIALND